jgi:hypothetical protein
VSVPAIAHRHEYSVDLKRRPPKSLPAASLAGKHPNRSILPDALAVQERGTQDSAVHVSLSSDSLVKQHGTEKPRLSLSLR